MFELLASAVLHAGLKMTIKHLQRFDSYT